MIHVQEPEVEELIRRRQAVMDCALLQRRRMEELDRSAHTYAWIFALNLQKPSNLVQLTRVLEQLTSEVASARAAVEHDRTLNGL